MIDLKRRPTESYADWRARTAREVSEGMRAIDPEGYGEAEAVVQRNVAAAEKAGAFGRRPTSH